VLRFCLFDFRCTHELIRIKILFNKLCVHSLHDSFTEVIVLVILMWFIMTRIYLQNSEYSSIISIIYFFLHSDIVYIIDHIFRLLRLSLRYLEIISESYKIIVIHFLLANFYKKYIFFTLPDNIYWKIFSKNYLIISFIIARMT